MKSNSQGEYIFDHNWAHAFERAGGRYYPKLQISMPFTPVTGRRLLVSKNAPNNTASLLLKVLLHSVNKIIYLVFTLPFVASRNLNLGSNSECSDEFHSNFIGSTTDIGIFDDFLNALSSRKRKNINKERAKANDFGGQIEILSGTQIKKDHWSSFWDFYQDTGAKSGERLI